MNPIYAEEWTKVNSWYGSFTNLGFKDHHSSQYWFQQPSFSWKCYRPSKNPKDRRANNTDTKNQAVRKFNFNPAAERKPMTHCINQSYRVKEACGLFAFASLIQGLREILCWLQNFKTKDSRKNVAEYGVLAEGIWLYMAVWQDHSVPRELLRLIAFWSTELTHNYPVEGKISASNSALGFSGAGPVFRSRD